MKITRSMFDAEIELRTEGEKRTLVGYAAKFDKLSVPLWGFREKIKKGAFTESLKKTNVRALWNHNTDMVLGSTGNGTLQLEEDETGLRFELELPDTQVGRDAGVSVDRRDVDGMSFAFEVRKQEWDETDKENVVRTLLEVDVKEVSPTAFPAYPSTKVTARSIKDDYEDFSTEKQSEEEKRQLTINEFELKQHYLTILEREML